MPYSDHLQQKQKQIQADKVTVAKNALGLKCWGLETPSGVLICIVTDI